MNLHVIITLSVVLFLFQSANAIPSENKSNLGNELLIQNTNDIKTLNEKIGNDESNIERNIEEINSIRNDFNSQISVLHQTEINNLYITSLVTVVSVLISGYVGWRIHKREFISNMASIHFADIKEKMIPQLEIFVGQIDYWYVLGKNIDCPTLNEIIQSRSLDNNVIRGHRTNSLDIGELDIGLFEDFVKNHYPEIATILEKMHESSTRYNEIRHKLIGKTETFLIEHVNSRYRTIRSTDTIPDAEKEIDGFPKNSCMIDRFASELITGIIANHTSDSFEIRRHRDGDAIAINSPTTKSQTSRVLFPNTRNDPSDDEFVKNTIIKFYTNTTIMNDLGKEKQIFVEFKKLLDDLKLQSTKIQSKVVLKTMTKFPLRSSCPYIKEKL